MNELRQGARSPEVRRLQQLLNSLRILRRPLVADGNFGGLTHNAVVAFQQQAKDLTANGVVDDKTWKALESDPRASFSYDYRVGPQEALADIAAAYLGATEAPGNRMGSDARMREIFEADNLAPGGVTDGYAWCCAFVSLCLQRLLAQSPMFPAVQAPRVASVTLFRTGWAVQQNCLVAPPGGAFLAHKGDIAVYTFSHIGIVERGGTGVIQTIEGNTNEQGSREGTTCRRKERAQAQIRCFVRLPVTKHYDERREVCLAPQAQQTDYSSLTAAFR
jgi:Putative peptidoglycan binding domain